MKKFAALISMIIIGLLWVLNPDKNDFSVYVSERLQAKIGLTESNTFDNKTLLSGIDRFSKGVNGTIGNSNDYFLFSIHDLKLGKTKYRYLGIAKTFIPLDENKPE